MRRHPTVPDDCKVFTPPSLAEAMAGVLPNRIGDRWLEPCAGGGVFLSSLIRQGVAACQITAVELDHHDGMTQRCGSYLPGVDFLNWSLNTPDRFDRVIGNPPYLSLHRVPADVRSAAFRVQRPVGGFVPPKANCWYAFVCASLRLLRPGGGLCFVLPSGWEYADYAADLRMRLPELFAHVEVVRSDASFFTGVLDGNVILIADGYGRPGTAQTRSEHRSLPEVIAHLNALKSRTVVAPLQKEEVPNVLLTRPQIRFGDLARVRIGAVTGDTGYFLFTESERVEIGLALEDVRPVLTRARHLKGACVTRDDWTRLAREGERVWLFWPQSHPGRPRKALIDYLEAGRAAECHLREKVRVRTPWYRTRIPPPADGFISGMTPSGPWIALNRMRGLSATNTLYTVHFADRLSLQMKAAWALALMCSSTASQHRAIGRRYSDGLLKFEPKDVMALNIPTPVTWGTESLSVYQFVANELILGETEMARAAAQAYVCSGKVPSRTLPRHT
jgi:hypothetical protein